MRVHPEYERFCGVVAAALLTGMQHGLAMAKKHSIGGITLEPVEIRSCASWGVPGFRVGQSADGRRYLSIGVPGTGLSYVHYFKGNGSTRPGGSCVPSLPSPPVVVGKGQNYVIGASATTAMELFYQTPGSSIGKSYRLQGRSRVGRAQPRAATRSRSPWYRGGSLCLV